MSNVDFYRLGCDLLAGAEKLEEVSATHPQIAHLPFDMKRVGVLLISYFPKREAVPVATPTLQEALEMLRN